MSVSFIWCPPTHTKRTGIPLHKYTQGMSPYLLESDESPQWFRSKFFSFLIFFFSIAPKLLTLFWFNFFSGFLWVFLNAPRFHWEALFPQNQLSVHCTVFHLIWTNRDRVWNSLPRFNRHFPLCVDYSWTTPFASHALCYFDLCIRWAPVDFTRDDLWKKIYAFFPTYAVNNSRQLSPDTVGTRRLNSAQQCNNDISPQSLYFYLIGPNSE